MTALIISAAVETNKTKQILIKALMHHMLQKTVCVPTPYLFITNSIKRR